MFLATFAMQTSLYRNSPNSRRCSSAYGPKWRNNPLSRSLTRRFTYRTDDPTYRLRYVRERKRACERNGPRIAPPPTSPTTASHCSTYVSSISRRLVWDRPVCRTHGACTREIKREKFTDVACEEKRRRVTSYSQWSATTGGFTQYLQ